MNWVFTHQGEDLIKDGENYYEWDKQYSQYKLIPKKSFESWLGYEEYDDTSAGWDYDTINGDAVILSGEARLD